MEYLFDAYDEKKQIKQLKKFILESLGLTN